MLKENELKLIAELMTNSHRSDRELAKPMGTTQPTISRTRERLEREGVIREYTIIPDFSKLGFSLCAFTLMIFDPQNNVQNMKEIIEKYGEKSGEFSRAVLIERGMGEKADGIAVSFHENFSDFVKFEEWLKQFSLDLRYFIINLDDRNHNPNLTFQTLAKHLLEKQTK